MKTWIGRWLAAGVCAFWVLGCGPSAPSVSLHQAVQRGDVKLVQQHIAAGTDLNAKDRSGWTALHLAAMKGDLPMVKALCAARAETSLKGPGGKTPLDLARERGKPAIAQFLQDRPQTEQGGRGLVDGGLGVSEVLDNP